MKVIAFGHRKDVGKDQSAKFLTTIYRQQKPGSNVQTLGFADKVKDIAWQLYAWTDLKPGYYYEESTKEKDIILPKIGKTPRQLWIDLANGIRERVYEPTWAYYLFHELHTDLLIIKDLRFPTEAKYIQEYGGYVFKINRPGRDRSNDGADDQLEDFNNWDAVLENNAGLGYLYNLIEKLAYEYVL